MSKLDSKQMFAGYSIFILASSMDAAKVLAQVFNAKGGLPKAITSKEDTLEALSEGPMDVLLYMVDEDKAKEAAKFARQVIESKPKLKVFWTISENIIPYTDGFTPYEFKPPELLKPIYYSLMLDKDLQAHG